MGVPWLRTTYEGLFEGDGLARLHAFLGIPGPSMDAGSSPCVDAYRFLVPSTPDLASAAGHPRVWEVAAALGYARPGPDGILWRGCRLNGA